MAIPSSDLAFTPSVKSIQLRRGSRRAYERLEERGGWPVAISPELAAFIAARDSFYLATANAAGQPYVQHRGGPKGFLCALDERTLGFADFRGNRQYITLGNLAENERAFIFLIDYARQSRVKLWGRARVVEDDASLIERLAVAGYEGKPEQAILFTVEAWDANCRSHIPQLLPAAEVNAAVAALERRIEALERENASLRRALGAAAGAATPS
jgi:predicted pyridoxine 5'-phosphate oxidase superfamily flavin-nucleotide-binding protein